mgnify:FL=1
MRQLVIETATDAWSVALFDDGACVPRVHDIFGRGHAERLLPVIAALPEGGRADRIAVDTGPGSFTGLRVGLAAARALGFAWDVSVEGYSALALVAHMARPAHGNETPIAVVMTGGHGELFWQMFEAGTVRPLSSPCSTPIAQLATKLDCACVYGSGAEVLIAARGSGEAVLLHPDAARFPLLPPEWLEAAALPFYGRGADAVPQAARNILP